MATTRPSIMSDGATTSAPASAWLTRDPDEQLDGAVVIDLASVQDAAVPVIGVFAGADVADHQHLRQSRA